MSLLTIPVSEIDAESYEQGAEIPEKIRRCWSRILRDAVSSGFVTIEDARNIEDLPRPLQTKAVHMVERGEAKTLTAAGASLREMAHREFEERTSSIFWVWCTIPVRQEGDLLALEAVNRSNPGAILSAVAREGQPPRKVSGRCVRCQILIFEDDRHAHRNDDVLRCGECHPGGRG